MTLLRKGQLSGKPVDNSRDKVVSFIPNYSIQLFSLNVTQLHSLEFNF